MPNTVRRLLVVLAILAMATVVLQAKPNFTGDWKMNAAESEFGDSPFAPSAMTQKITHEEPSLQVASTMSTEMGDMQMDAKYTTDGKECTNSFGPGEMKSTLKWDGDSLVIEGKGDFGGGAITMKDIWVLSEDGKKLTQTRTMSSDMGEMTQKMVLDKQ